MSTTNPSPCFKGLGQKMTRAVEGSLWGVQAEIWELERKFKVAYCKMQAHYQEWLEEHKWDWEALLEELERIKKGEILSTPKPSMPSPQTTLRQKKPAVPAGPSMPMSPQVVLKNFLSWGYKRLWVTPRIDPVKESHLSQCTGGGPGEVQQQERVQRA